MGPIDIAIDIAIWGGLVYGVFRLTRHFLRLSKERTEAKR